MRIIEVGREALEFKAQDSENAAPFRLSAQRGQFVVLYFYPKDNTPSCTLEAVEFSALAAEFAKAGALVVGLSPDTPACHQKFRAKHGLTHRLITDADHHIAELYGVWVEKSLYGRTYMGVERATFLIDPDGRVTNIWRKVRSKGHAQAVLDVVLGMTQPLRAD